jgi:4'-phosphopantetheinyl transferase
LTGSGAPVEHVPMQLMGESAFEPGPLSVDPRADSIDVWFFGHWPAPRGAAESAPLRRLLARYLGMPPEQVRIARDGFGKPRVVDSTLEFNLSHCESSALVAVGRGTALGIDLEKLRRDRPVLALAQRFFAASEAAALDALPAQRRQRAFLELWSCKEALLKALGRGLAFGLERIVFELDRNGSVRGLVHVDGDAPSEWQVIGLAPAANCCGALAWRGAPQRLRLCHAAPMD